MTARQHPHNITLLKDSCMAKYLVTLVLLQKQSSIRTHLLYILRCLFTTTHNLVLKHSALPFSYSTYVRVGAAQLQKLKSAVRTCARS